MTAQRFEQSLQDTPLAVTAVTEEEFSKYQVERLDDLVNFVPNIVIEQNTGTSSGAKIFLRGVGQDESLFTADPAVAIYIDDVYIPRQTGSQIALYDVERIEVLRGPQGTLYGRNATGGAIKYITRKPEGSNTGKVEVSLGNFSRKDVRASMDLGFGESGNGLQLAVMSKNRDGFSKNLSTGADVNDQEVHAARLGFRFGSADTTIFDIAADVVKERSGPGFASCILATPLQVARPNNPVTGAATPPFNYAACNLDRDLYTVESNIKDLNNLDQSGLSAVSQRSLSASRGATSLQCGKWRICCRVILMAPRAPCCTYAKTKSKIKALSSRSLLVTATGVIGWLGCFISTKAMNSRRGKTCLRPA
ncbi:TonB-dependent receptor plug domain-containing protein [bacterium]|nr:TonB-dependent receptor plug domain-containing protein [bacterium]